ncbi:hypothetical protein CEV34_1938 [Brucella pseudogrignonensis]|uniref:Uncharacterized protein n=1 Tax=Brucella pseudogrignonensis TaxID=419475 RepID=A0A256GJG2_9HYPH|nr:hypothetical protein CEV34_1938 [Brucella pseudogrignonensis]
MRRAIKSNPNAVSRNGVPIVNTSEAWYAPEAAFSVSAHVSEKWEPVFR